MKQTKDPLFHWLQSDDLCHWDLFPPAASTIFSPR
jgi:hypothetical protein